MAAHDTPDRRTFLAAASLGIAVGANLSSLGMTQAQAQSLPLRTDSNAPFQHMPPAEQAPAKTGLVDIPGAQLFYWDTGGTGTPIVLMHPASGSAMIWAYQQAAFAKAGYRVIAYSRRGYAKSSPFDKANPGSGSEDLAAFAAALNLPRFHLIASAAGGSISMDFTLSYPDKLLSLTISSNSAGVREGAIFKAAEQSKPQGWDKMPVEFRELGPSYRAVNAAGTKLWLDLEHHALIGTDYRQVPTNRITDASLKNVKVPTLLMTGAADLITPPAIMRLVRDAIPGAQMVVAEETGHSLYWERPDLFNSTVLEFLARVSKTK
jgi:pimeloyl-ACP methyl ester carboxylesterase